MSRAESANLTLKPWLYNRSGIGDLLDGHIDNENRAMEEMLDGFVIPTICVLGFLGNIVNLLVLTRSRFRQNEGSSETGAQLGLIAISLSDMFFCAFMFPRAFIRSTHSLFPSRSFLLYYQAYGTGLVTTFSLVSTWITVAVATLRYFGICHPLRARQLIGAGIAKAAYAALALLSCLSNLPAFWQFQINDLPMDNNKTYYLLDIGYMDFNTASGMTFQWFKVIYGVFIPAALLIFCNWSLVLALRRSYKMRKQCFVNETASRSRNRLTLTLVTIVTTFILLVFPSELMDFFLERIHMDYDKTELFLKVRSFANTLQVVNFACNFFLYCTVNSQFRSSFRQLLGCRVCVPSQLEVSRAGHFDNLMRPKQNNTAGIEL